ncbi:MAG: hypothetical protein OHK0046_36260 [Anaerolineae bacterium]
MGKVLVIEDELNILDTLIEAFELEGYEVRGASSGKQGLILAKSFDPDIILCDVLMPKPDGYDVLQNLKADRTTNAIPVLLLSARTSRESIEMGLQLGAEYYITKPFTTQDLLRIVRSYVEPE